MALELFIPRPREGASPRTVTMDVLVSDVAPADARSIHQ